MSCCFPTPNTLCSHPWEEMLRTLWPSGVSICSWLIFRTFLFCFTIAHEASEKIVEALNRCSSAYRQYPALLAVEEEAGGLHVVFTSFFQGCIHCRCGGCVLGCFVRQQGMALNSQNTGHTSTWAAIPTSGWIILWNALIGSYRDCAQDQFSLQQSKPCQGKWWQAWDKECGKEQLSHHHLYTAGKGGQLWWEAGRAVGLAPDGGAG